MTRDARKYKALHLATNAEYFFGSRKAAEDKARAIDGMLLARQSPELRYEHIDTYRYGRKR